MRYTYTGSVQQELVAAYGSDRDPFPRCTDRSFPCRRSTREEVDFLRRLFFPTCWNAGQLCTDPEAVAAELAQLGEAFATGVAAYSETDPTETVDTVLSRLPAIREQLKRDVEAAYRGDPAATAYLEIIRSYPGFQAIMIHRIAHEIFRLGEPQYARELAEYAHATTGIDIHPGAEIGDYFFIDHGTGVVIGETTTIGDWVRIYQEVTLGALHFKEAEGAEHMLEKGYNRHPDVGDHVVIGAGAKVLGPIAIGDNVSIGANSWITDDIPDNTKVYVAEHPTQERKRTDSAGNHTDAA